MVLFRKATEKDIEILARLRVKFLQEVEKPGLDEPSAPLNSSVFQHFTEKMRKNEFISWVAVEKDEIIATSGVSILEVPPSFGNITGKEAYVMNMYTKPKFRKKGIGTQLLDIIIDEIREEDIKKIRLHTTEIGKPIYLKKGFKDSNSEMVLYLD